MAIATLEAIARKPRSATTTWHCIANCLAGANAPTEWPPAGRAHRLPATSVARKPATEGSV